MSKPTKPDPTESPAYLVITPVEELIDAGLVFDGDTDKDRLINQFDFSRIREIIQRLNAQLTDDQRETLIRYLRLCVKQVAA
jgi:hypothetical protein